ncbi:hypothetical protein GCM10007981_02580 [Thermocladium modestius]|uniref:Arcadin 1 domain-containing protein n=1 Tax=Thermocladium modestius TaxID=62609 RepID=A0A830GTV3_9CREN|nr:arcadin 1 [Thermocladium modestius]GGP19330.1 hypothetical protein GCM10007981_02580 [Thermocladium modestius]
MVSFKGYVFSKTLMPDPLGNKLIKIDIVEEKETPGPVVTGADESAMMAREVMNMMQQVLKSMPILNQALGNKVMVPRVTIWLTDDEIEYLGGRLDVGDYVEVSIQNGSINIKRL